MSKEIEVVIESSNPVADPVQMNRVKYDDVSNKPRINGVELVGDKSTADLKIDVDTSKFATKNELAGKADKSDIPDVSGKADKATTLSGYGITDAYTKAETDAKIGAVYHVKGSVADYDSLPDGASIGDVYNLLDTGANYVWTDNGWDKLSETVDLSDYATKSEIPDVSGLATKSELESKQDKLTAGENITIEDGVISATGGGGGVSLPDQTGNAGKFLMTDGTNASWSDKPLVNTAKGTLSLCVGGLGNLTTGLFETAVGTNSFCNGGYGVGIGYAANVKASRAIQLGTGENNDANTFKVANQNGNFEIMSADGTIPAARHAALPTEDGTYVLKCVMSGGVPTMTWVKE